MINILRDITDIEEFKSRYPDDTVVAWASVRGVPITVLKAFEREDVKNILPVIVLKGIEYDAGTEDDYYQHYLMAKNRVKELYGDSKTLFEPVIYSNVELFRLFNIGYADHLAKTYGIVNACITCKAYYTLAHIHIACLLHKRLVTEKKLNSKSEIHTDRLRARLSENDRLLFEAFGIEAIKVLQGRSDGDEAIRLMGVNWYIPKGASCLFTKMWRSVNEPGSNNKFNIPEAMIEDYVHPVSKLLIYQLNSNFRTTPEQIDNIILSHLKGGNYYE